MRSLGRKGFRGPQLHDVFYQRLSLPEQILHSLTLFDEKIPTEGVSILVQIDSRMRQRNCRPRDGLWDVPPRRRYEHRDAVCVVVVLILLVFAALGQRERKNETGWHLHRCY